MPTTFQLNQVVLPSEQKKEAWECQELKVEGVCKPVRHYLLPEKYLPAVASKSTSTELSTTCLKDTDLSDWQREVAVARAKFAARRLSLAKASVKRLLLSR